MTATGSECCAATDLPRRRRRQRLRQVRRRAAGRVRTSSRCGSTASWDENYGAAGAAERCATSRWRSRRDAELRFSYDHATPPVTVAPADGTARRPPMRTDSSRGDQPAQGPHARAVLLRDGRPVRQRRHRQRHRRPHRRPARRPGTTRRDKGFYHGGDLAGLHRAARLHRGPRHHGDLDDAVVQEQAGAGHARRPSQRRLPRLLDHRLHPDRPAPGHQRRAQGS